MTGPRTLATDYDLYEIAYLAGGPGRVVDTAVVALVESRRLRVIEETGELSVVHPRSCHGVEAAVLDAVGQRPHRSVETVRWRVEASDQLVALEQRLCRDGLLRPAAARTTFRRRHWQALCLTGEGRRTLRHLRSEQPVDRVAAGTSALLVALTGTGAMTDRRLRNAVFEPPPLPRTRGALGVAGYGSTSYGYAGFAAGDGGLGGFGGDCGGGDGGGC
jgi:hypothetical protein